LLLFLPQFMADPGSTRFRLAAPRGYPDSWRTKRPWHAQSGTPFEVCRILDPQPSACELTKIRQHFASAFPEIGLPTIGRSWAGMIDVTPDSLPVIDHAPIPGLIVATGMSGHRFGIGPGVAGVLSDLAMARPPRHDLPAFRFEDSGDFVNDPRRPSELATDANRSLDIWASPLQLEAPGASPRTARHSIARLCHIRHQIEPFSAASPAEPELQCRYSIPRPCDDGLQDFTFVVDRAPEPVCHAADGSRRQTAVWACSIRSVPSHG
jgi:hypothetical protein